MPAAVSCGATPAALVGRADVGGWWVAVAGYPEAMSSLRESDCGWCWIGFLCMGARQQPLLLVAVQVEEAVQSNSISNQHITRSLRCASSHDRKGSAKETESPVVAAAPAADPCSASDEPPVDWCSTRLQATLYKAFPLVRSLRAKPELCPNAAPADKEASTLLAYLIGKMMHHRQQHKATRAKCHFKKCNKANA
jgi:hypothetical protein